MQQHTSSAGECLFERFSKRENVVLKGRETRLLRLTQPTSSSPYLVFPSTLWRLFSSHRPPLLAPPPPPVSSPLPSHGLAVLGRPAVGRTWPGEPLPPDWSCPNLFCWVLSVGKQEAFFFCEFSYFLFLIFLGVSFSWMRHGYAGFGGSGDYASRYRFMIPVMACSFRKRKIATFFVLELK